MASRQPPADFVDRLRARILNLIHLWGIAPGARLPGVREIARESGVDHRVVAQGYRVLEAEGLVEVRGRSGVYAAELRGTTDTFTEERVGWMGDVLAAARQRRIPLAELPRMVGDAVSARRLRCALVESNDDQMVAYAWELEKNYALEVVRVPVGGNGKSEPAWAKVFADADLLATTPHHATRVRAAARAAGRPMVVLTIDPEAVRDLAELLSRRIQERQISVVVATEEFAERLRSMAAGAFPRADEIRYVLATDERAIASLDPQAPVIVTRAAQARLRRPTPPVFLLHQPLLAPDSIRDLCSAIARLNLAPPAE